MILRWQAGIVKRIQVNRFSKYSNRNYDVSSSTGTAILQRTTFGQGNFQNLASVSSIDGGYLGTWTNKIAYATIDNLQYAYWVIWVLPATTDVRGCGMFIEYDFRLYLPVTLRGSP